MGANDAPDESVGQLPWQEDQVPEPSNADSADFHIQSSEEDGDHEDGRLPIPVWMRESSKSFHWRWVPVPMRHAARSIARWSKGPDPPQIQRITPLVPFIQEAPLRLVDRFLPKKSQKAVALLALYSSWALTFSMVIWHETNSGTIEGYGKPSSIWCGANYWSSDPSGCGINGNQCRPFENIYLPFQCTADCAGVQVLSKPHVVGDQEIRYHNLVIGGAKDEGSDLVYRADSFICQAAIHAGVLSNERGGCGVLLLQGKQSYFPNSSRNGIDSIGFDAEFPKSFTFESGLSSNCGEVDLRWPLLAVTVGFTTILSIFTASPAVFFPSVFTMLFFHVGLVSDRPNISDYPSLASLMIGRFLPAAFTGFVIYNFCVRPQMTSLTAQVEKTVLWMGGAWIGSLNNYTFDKIPIQRLTPHDIRSQPGAPLALALIVLLLILIAGQQIYYLRLEGRFIKYLKIYALMASFLILCIIIPPLNLRIHHYILALLLLPGTGIQTRPSLLYQGILVGLFINGIARWGFDSLLQTSTELFGPGGGDPSIPLYPNITAPVIGLSNITFQWMWPPPEYDGITFVVNDVERHRWYKGEGRPTWTWRRREKSIKEYFRFAYMSGTNTAEYTKASILNEHMDWVGWSPEDWVD